MEFTYTNQKPPIARPGTTTNVINLRWKGNDLIYGRRYVSKDGSVSKISIEYTFNGIGDNVISAENVAKKIHWGCCGWSAGGHEIWQLIKKISDFLESNGS